MFQLSINEVLERLKNPRCSVLQNINKFHKIDKTIYFAEKKGN